jgi:heme oxygenase
MAQCAGAAHRSLRDATTEAHRAAEDALGVRERLTPVQYGRCLAVFLAVFAPAEAMLRGFARTRPGSWVPDARAVLAESDLVWIRSHDAAGGHGTEAARAVRFVAPTALPEALGYAYVLEGSTRGAAVMAARVAAELPGYPSAFFSAPRPGRWESFIATLDVALNDDELQSRAAVAALRLFAVFTARAESSVSA